MSERKKLTERLRPTALRVLGGVVLLLSLATVGQTYLQNEASRAQARCIKTYANGFADALEARASASADAQDALDEFLNKVAAIAPSAEGQAKARAAFLDYLAKRAAAKQAQSAHPFPAAPRDVCG